MPKLNNVLKIFGLIFDDRLNLEKHINRVVSTCHANVRDLSRIASKLNKTPKVQLVCSLILSHIGYRNAWFCKIPENLLHKLTKVLNAATRFIFDFVVLF